MPTPPSNTTPPDDKRPGLEGLERELYRRGDSDELAKRAQDIERIGLRRYQLQEQKTDDVPVSFASLAQQRAQRRRRLIRWSVVLLLVVGLFGGAIAGTVWYRLRRNVTPDQLGITVTTAAAITAGETVTYEVTYANNSYVDWQSVEVVFDGPPGFTLTETQPEMTVSGRSIVLLVGNLAKGAGGTATISGRLLAEENATVVAQAEIAVTPENFPSGRFTRKALATATVQAVPVQLAVEMSGEAAPGERIRANITVTNASNQTFAELYIKISPDPGMQLAVDDPQFSAGFSVPDSEWIVTNLAPLAQASQQAIVSVTGQPGEKRNLTVEVGVREQGQRFVQRTLVSTTTVSSSELTITQRYNDATSPLVVSAGERVRGVIGYANTGNLGLSDAVVRLKIEGTGFNPASLKLPAGAYDPVSKTITWTSASVRALGVLQPQQTGELPFEFQVAAVESLPTTGPTTSNHTLVLTASIDSPDVNVPVGQTEQTSTDRFVMSVATSLTLDVAAFYDDGRLGLASTGPNPPHVGEQTTYTVRLRVGSPLNDAGDVRVVAVLPEGVRYTNQVVKTSGDVTFNDRTGELVWQILQLPALTGRTAPAAELDIQVAITPGEDQRGEAVPFLNRLSAAGTDLFTDRELSTVITKFPASEDVE